MAGSWFPTWLLAVMSLLYAGIVAVHVAHLRTQRGAGLLWTALHVLMAAGMLVMVLPLDRMLLGGTGVALLYVVTGLGCLVVAVRTWRGPGGSQLWFLAVVDLAAMAYMFAPGSARSLVVSLLLAVVLAVESAYWASGYLAETADRDGLTCTPVAAIHHASSSVEPDRGVLVATAPAGSLTSARVALPAGFLTHPWALRASMALMGLGMAYMLVAMALPATSASGGGHVHAMAGR